MYSLAIAQLATYRRRSRTACRAACLPSEATKSSTINRSMHERKRPSSDFCDAPTLKPSQIRTLFSRKHFLPSFLPSLGRRDVVVLAFAVQCCVVRPPPPSLALGFAVQSCPPRRSHRSALWCDGESALPSGDLINAVAGGVHLPRQRCML